MGVSIGNIPSTLIAARRQAPAVEPGASTLQSNPNAQSNPNRPGQRPAAETLQAGFGPGTVSGPAAALVAIGRSVRAARETIPTLDEIREQFQASRAVRSEEFSDQTEALRTRLAERRESQGFTVPAADALAFHQFTEAREFSQLTETEPVELGSARPPEAPEFASAEQPEDAVADTLEPAETGFAPTNVQRERLNLTA